MFYQPIKPLKAESAKLVEKYIKQLNISPEQLKNPFELFYKLLNSHDIYEFGQDKEIRQLIENFKVSLYAQYQLMLYLMQRQKALHISVPLTGTTSTIDIELSQYPRKQNKQTIVSTEYVINNDGERQTHQILDIDQCNTNENDGNLNVVFFDDTSVARDEPKTYSWYATTVTEADNTLAEYNADEYLDQHVRGLSYDDDENILLSLADMGLFSGLYNSIWLNEDSDSATMEVLIDDLSCTKNDIDVSIDTDNYLKQIANHYINFMASAMNIELDSLSIHHIFSPPYYNYDTDNIVLKLDTKKIPNWKILLTELLKDVDSLYEYESYSIYNPDIYNELVEYQYIDENKVTHNIDYNTETEKYIIVENK